MSDREFEKFHEGVYRGETEDRIVEKGTEREGEETALYVVDSSNDWRGREESSKRLGREREGRGGGGGGVVDPIVGGA